MNAGRSERTESIRDGVTGPRRVPSVSARDAVVSETAPEMVVRLAPARVPVFGRGPRGVRAEPITERLQTSLQLAARVLAALRSEIDHAGRAAADLSPARLEAALTTRAESIAGEIETRVEARLAAIDRSAAQQLAAIEAAGDFLLDLRDRTSAMVERLEQLEVQAAKLTRAIESEA